MKNSWTDRRDNTVNMKKTALITGSSRGIGKATAQIFAENGYNIVLNCIENIELMENFEKELKEKGISCMSFACDVSDYAKAGEMFEAVKKTFGGVDVLINNAGVATYGLFNTSLPAEWDYIMKNNFYSVMNCCHHAIPYMLEKREGSIVNLSSIWGVTGASCETLYSASKGAVSLFTKALAKELGPNGIRVNAIAPGAIDTDMTAPFTGEVREEMEYSIPLSRFGTAGEVAHMIFAMAENTYMNGQVILLDGGTY